MRNKPTSKNRITLPHIKKMVGDETCASCAKTFTDSILIKADGLYCHECYNKQQEFKQKHSFFEIWEEDTSEGLNQFTGLNITFLIGHRMIMITNAQDVWYDFWEQGPDLTKYPPQSHHTHQLKEETEQGNTKEITDLKRQIETNRQIFNREISELRKQIEDLDEYLITRLKEII